MEGKQVFLCVRAGIAVESPTFEKNKKENRMLHHSSPLPLLLKLHVYVLYTPALSRVRVSVVEGSEFSV